MTTNIIPGARPKTILSVKNKGGVGGSHNAMATATVLRMSAITAFTTVLIDLDGSTGTSISRMGERDEHGQLKEEQSLANGVAAIDMLDPLQRSALFDLTEIEDQFLILDGPATSLSVFRNFSENLRASDWVQHNRACGRDLIVMVPITPHLSSISNVAQAIEIFGSEANYIVVRSMRGCSPSDYILWDEPEFRDRYGRIVSGRSRTMLEEAGGIVLDMPPLNAAVLARVEAMQVPFAEAVRSPHLRAPERMSVARWLESWARELDKARDILGLSADFEWRVR